MFAYNNLTAYNGYVHKHLILHYINMIIKYSDIMTWTNSENEQLIIQKYKLKSWYFLV